MNGEGHPGYRSPDNFITVSDPYPTVTALAADVILPTAMCVAKDGACGKAERRTRFWCAQVAAPGEAKSDLWQAMELARRVATDAVWDAELPDTMPALKGKTLCEVLCENGKVNAFPVSEAAEGFDNHESADFGFCVKKGLFEEYAAFGRDRGHDLADFDV